MMIHMMDDIENRDTWCQLK